MGEPLATHPRPRIAAVGAIGLLLLLSIGCGGAKKSAPPEQVHDGPLTVRPVVLAQQPPAGPTFSCTSGRGREEVQRGPSAKTNLRQVTVVRSRRGICVVFTFPRTKSATALPPSSALPPSGVLRLTFYRNGDTSAPAEIKTSGLPQHSVEITAYNDPTSQSPGQYLLSTSIPQNGGNGASVTLGRLGIGARTVSLLVAAPKMPAWVLDKSTVWRGQIV